MSGTGEEIIAKEGRFGATDIEELWRTFWLPIIAPSGNLDMEQIKRELFDYYQVMGEVSKVYDYVTGGMISKVNTEARIVIAVFEDYLQELIAQEAEDSLHGKKEET